MQKYAWGFFICVLFLIRFVTYEQTHVSHIQNTWFDTKRTLVGVITNNPDHGLETTKIVLGDLGILATIQNGTNVSYGDEVALTGFIKHPENFMTDTGREFDYVNYLKVHDVYGLMKVSHIEIISRHNKNVMIEKLFSIKKYFVNSIKKILPRNEAGLFAGISIGEKSLLDKNILNDFQIAGMSHMIVLSGYNITIVATSIITLCAYLGFGYRARRIGAIIVIPLFLAMTGFGASSVRAGVMALLIFITQIITRPMHNLRSIIYTAGLMVFLNPRILMHDPSFHMSFLALIGLVYVAPIMNHWLNKNESDFFLKKITIETMSVQFFMLPYILWMSGRVSLFILLANLLTIPSIPMIMGMGFMTIMIGMISYPLEMILVKPIQLLLTYIIWVAHQIASMKFAIINIPPFGAWVILVAYAGMSIFLVRNAIMDSSSSI